MVKEQRSFDIRRPFGNLFRSRSTLVVVTDNEGKALFGGKEGYPEGFTRLPGGGAENCSTPDNPECMEAWRDVVTREIGDELGIDLERSSIRMLALVYITANLSETPELSPRTTEVGILSAKVPENSIPEAGDDVSKIDRLNADDWHDLIIRMQQIDATLKQGKAETAFYWSDYGRVYSQLHWIALRESLRHNII